MRKVLKYFCGAEKGEKWCFEGEGFAVDDKVRLLMDTNCTDFNFEDDKIVNVFRA